MFKHVPNILSAFRIGLVPIFATIYFSDQPNASRIALIIYLIAGMTDILDGYLARKYDLITKIGTVLDPLADKLMQLTAISCLAIDHVIPYWLMGLFLFKESGMIIMGSYMYMRKAKTVMPANKFGKAGTVLFSLAIFVTILRPDALISFLLILLALLLKIIALSTYSVHYFTKIKPHL